MQERIEREVQIVLDEKSVKVLKELSKIHINSFINYCIRLGEKSDLYEILMGKTEKVEVPKIIEKEEPEEKESKNSNTSSNSNASNASKEIPTASQFSMQSTFSDF